MNTTGNTVLITGGSAGIGFALAKKFWETGNQVIIIGRNAAKLAAAKAKLPSIHAEQLDITDSAGIAQLALAHPNINIVINNAGIQFNYAFTDPNVAIDKIATEVNINVTAPMEMAHVMIPHLMKQQDAAIINVSSGLAIVPKEAAPVYCASKSAIHIFTKALRWQLESTPIKVFEIIPPIVDTAMTAGRGEGKITPEALVEEFWGDFGRNNYESRIGRTKQLHLLNRFLPAIADRIMRNGL